VQSTFLATPEKGAVSSILLFPQSAEHILVLGHGAGANMQHQHMESLAQALFDQNIATFRYNFPYMERGGKGRDSLSTSLMTVRSAVEAAQTAVGNTDRKITILAGGHSFGGRMTSLAQAESPLPAVEGLVFFSFPLHPSGKSDTKRADHLKSVQIPMLFLSGDRDKLADLELLKGVMGELDPTAEFHLLNTADHSFKILKRTRKHSLSVYEESAQTLEQWIMKIPED
jgi:predicted alpha/beta-hydrolase family hydrolase